MAFRTIVITAAISAVTMLGTIGSASAACGCKSQWERNKPHVNVGATAIMVKNELTTGNNSTQGNPDEPEVIVRRKGFLVENF